MSSGPSSADKTVADIMTRDVAKVLSSDSISSVAQTMAGRKIGSVVVMDGEKVTGILTERDMLVRVLDGKRDPKTSTVADVMTSPVITVAGDTTLFYASQLMERNHCRRLPVVDEGRLVGIVTQTDLAKALANMMIDLVPRTESGKSTTPLKMDLEAGKTYVIEEKKPQKSLEIFADTVKHGRLGLCMARTNPKEIRDSYGLATTPIIWVTDVRTDEPRLDPSDLQGVSNTAMEFVKKAEGGIIFFEAFNYLIARNDFPKVMRILQQVRDATSQGNCSILVHIDPVLLTEKELQQLMEEVDDVRFRAY